ncbi:MAG: ribosome silencing factor [Eubacteriales bacterium]|jgi:ribosome-associated protein|nr:ribosome silencing factor [Eubacteriales bacterium]
MNTREMSMLAAQAIDRRKGQDVLVIDVAAKSSFADFMVLGSGGSARQIGALAEEVEDTLAKEGILVKSIEGKKESGWILMDYGDIIVNLMTAEMRARYNIESVWGDCERLTIDAME